MFYGRRSWWALLAAALLWAGLGLALEGCATGSAGFRMGREPQGAQQLAYDRVLVQVYGEQGAVAKLVGSGVPPVEAAKRVLDAVVAGAAGGLK